MRRLAVVIVMVGCSKHSHRVEQIAAGPMDACALAEGHVTCWGESGAGMLGEDEMIGGGRMPRQLANITDATSISVGLSSACAVRRDRTLVCWGIDWAHATTGQSRALAAPTPVEGIADVVQVSAGRSHVCAVTGDGKVACWGDNFDTQCGQPRTSNVISTPTVVPGIGDAVEVAAGESFTCVRHRDGGVSCFGRMQLPKTEECPHGPGEACVKSYEPGQLEAATEGKEVPARVAGVAGATQIVAGDQFACALAPTGVWCWGDNALGQLGTTEVAAHAVRAKVEGAVAVSASSSWDVCALTKTGEVWCWGEISQLGATRGPARIKFPKASGLAAGDMFACAIVDGTVWCAGNGDHGETGHGHTEGPQPARRVEI